MHPCYVNKLLIDDGFTHQKGKRDTARRPVAVVEQLSSPDAESKVPFSRTRLFFDNGHGTLFFSRTVYTTLACGKSPLPLLDVSGTIYQGQGYRPGHKRQMNLHNASFTLRVYAAKPYKGRARYTLRVVISSIGYSKRFDNLQGLAEIYRF